MSMSLVWKESGLGSQQKLAEVKRALGPMAQKIGACRKGIGHSGTLDPFASGWLCVGIGEGTKVLSALVGLPKTYVAELVFGATSSTLDTESEILPAPHLKEICEELKKRSPKSFEDFLTSKIGVSEQIPPQHSAIKIGGKRAFDLARKGEVFELKPRSYEVISAQHMSLEEREVAGHRVMVWTFEVRVSSGTYIRSLARDWAHELVGYPGMLVNLTRTSIGPWSFFSHQNGFLPEFKSKELNLSDFEELVPSITLPSESAKALKSYGRWSGVPDEILSSPPIPQRRGFFVVDEAQPHVPIALLGPSGELQRVFQSNPFL